jgi:hypothetical protein
MRQKDGLEENESNDLMNPNFKNLFERFGGARKFG